jgi:hypothetical protein
LLRSDLYLSISLSFFTSGAAPDPPVEPKMASPFDGRKIPLHVAKHHFAMVPINVIVIMRRLGLFYYSALKMPLTKTFL